MTKNYTRPEKAVIFLMTLDEGTVGQVLDSLEEREIQRVANYITKLEDVDTQVMDMVSKEFYDLINLGDRGLGEGELDTLKTILIQEINSFKPNEKINNITGFKEELGGGLETVRGLDPKNISSLITNEHPQTAAIILAHLDSSLASATISELPEENRMEIVHRLATLDNISPSVIRDLDQALQAEFQNSSVVSDNKLGGVEVVAAVMSSLDRNTEIAILTSMDEIDTDLANKIRKIRFSFEDLIKVDDTGIQILIKEVNQEELLIALKTASDELKEKLYTNIGLVILKDHLKGLGPTKISDIKKAQQNIIKVCKQLEKEGKILLSGRRDDYV
jgi:flagellar motor switch protein FliG